MHQTKTGRWVPDKPKPPEKSSSVGDDTELAYLRDALAAGIMMPPWWPVMLFWAQIGREALMDDAW